MRDDHERHDDRDRRAAAVAAAAGRAARGPANAAEAQRLRNAISPTNEKMPTKITAMMSKPHVGVANVREFVREHGLKLFIVQRVHQSARDGDRVLSFVEPGRERVQLHRFP
jgi:hypothetical protein